MGFLAGWRHAAPLSPLAAAVAGSVITTWVTFVPCFLWIFLGAPYIEALRGKVALSAALSGVTAAVVGVILNLAVWFSIHTLFARVGEAHLLGARFLIPDLSTLDPVALVLARSGGRGPVPIQDRNDQHAAGLRGGGSGLGAGAVEEYSAATPLVSREANAGHLCILGGPLRRIAGKPAPRGIF